MTVIHNIEKNFSQYLFISYQDGCYIQEISHLGC